MPSCWLNADFRGPKYPDRRAFIRDLFSHQSVPGIGHVAVENKRSRSAPSPRKTWSWLRFSTADVGDFLRRYPRMNASVEVDDASAGPVSSAADSGKQAVRRSHLKTSWSMSMPNNEGRRTGIRGNPPTVGDLLLAVSAEKSRGFASKMSVNYPPRKSAMKVLRLLVRGAELERMRNNKNVHD